MVAADAVGTTIGDYVAIGTAAKKCDTDDVCEAVDADGTTANTLVKCKTLCTAKAIPDALLSTKATNAQCTGLEYNSTDNTCFHCFKKIPIATKDTAFANGQCYARKAWTQSEIFQNGKAGFSSDKDALIDGTLAASLKEKYDKVVEAKAEHDIGKAILAYISTQYRAATKSASMKIDNTAEIVGITKDFDTNYSDWVTKTAALVTLKNNADSAGMDIEKGIAVNPTDYDSVTKSTSVFQSELEAAKAVNDAAEALHVSATTEKTTQAAMKVITDAWKEAAGTTFTTINDK